MLAQPAVNPPLLLLDMQWPPVDGVAIRKTIRTTADWQNGPVVMRTVTSSPGKRIEATNLVTTEYVNTPFSPGRLLKTIMSWVPGPRRQPASEVKQT